MNPYSVADTVGCVKAAQAQLRGSIAQLAALPTWVSSDAIDYAISLMRDAAAHLDAALDGRVSHARARQDKLVTP